MPNTDEEEHWLDEVAGWMGDPDEELHTECIFCGTDSPYNKGYSDPEWEGYVCQECIRRIDEGGSNQGETDDDQNDLQ